MDPTGRKSALRLHDRSKRLEYLVQAQVHIKLAASRLSKDSGKTVSDFAFGRSITRLAEMFGFLSTADLLVWYELDYKGAAKTWQRQLGQRNWNTGTSRALRGVAEALEAERQGIKRRFDTAAAACGLSTRQLKRLIGAFARAEKLSPSLPWLIFLYCMYTELKKRERAAEESLG